MARFKDFPHPIINVKDESQRDVQVSQILPLHRPLFLTFAEKGEPNVIQYGTYSELVKKVGEGTFDEFSDYFKHPNLFLRMALQNQPVFFTRMTPLDAATASQVLEAHVWDADIPQWQRDGNDRFLLDGNDERMPIIVNQPPTITNMEWDDWNHIDSDTFVMTINALDPEADDLTYEVICDDANVTIVQTGVLNVWDITYPDYSGINTPVVYTVTVTDANLNSVVFTVNMSVNAPATSPVDHGYYFTDSVQYGEHSYMVEFHGAITSGTLGYSVVADDAGVVLTQDLVDPTRWGITYPIFASNTDVEFTMTIDDGATNTIDIVDTISVAPNPGETQVTEPGTMLRWETRELLPSESLSGILESTYVEGLDTVSVFPVLVNTPINGPGKFGNNISLQLHWDSEVDQDTVLDNEAMLYKIAIFDKPYGIDTPIYVRDFYDNGINDFAFKPNALDTTVNMRLDFDSIMTNNYRDKLPVNYHVYHENINLIGTRVLLLEDTVRVPELTSSWMVNVIEAMTVDSVPYYNFDIDIVDEEAELLKEDVIHYLEGGSDGDLSSANLETLTKLWLTGTVFPDVKDQARYPFNHLYDSGYDLETKEYMINFLGVREDVNIIISTQSANEEFNTKPEDQAAGSSLRMTALLHPESVIYGTQCCRVTVFMQAGYINFSTTYQDVVPLTLDALYKRCISHNSDYVKREWKGLPNSSVDMFREISWSPCNDDVKQLSWDTGLNYVQYYDMTRFHYPDIISIYPFHTSVVSSDLFTTYLVYLKQVIREMWAHFSGISESATKLSGRIKKKLDPKLYYMFKEYMTIDTSVYQTDEDEMLGYAMTIEIQVYDSVSKRVWNVPIKVRRIEDRE